MMKTLLVGLGVLVLIVAVIGAIAGAAGSQKGEGAQGAAGGAIAGAAFGLHQGFGCLIMFLLIGIVLSIGRCVLR